MSRVRFVMAFTQHNYLTDTSSICHCPSCLLLADHVHDTDDPDFTLCLSTMRRPKESLHLQEWLLRYNRSSHADRRAVPFAAIFGPTQWFYAPLPKSEGPVGMTMRTVHCKGELGCVTAVFERLNPYANMLFWPMASALSLLHYLYFSVSFYQFQMVTDDLSRLTV